MNTVFEMTLKRMAAQRLVLILMAVFPLLIALLPAMAGEGAPRLQYGMFGLVVMFSAFMLSKQVIEDRQYKTIVRIAASPITHRQYLLGHLAAYMLVLTVQVVLFWALAIVRFDAPQYFHVWGFVFLLGITVLGIAFALFWHTFFKSYATSIAVYSIAVNIMAMIGGLSFPLSIMPDTLRRIAVVLPTYWYAYGLEFVVAGDGWRALLCLLILVGFAIIFLVIGSKRRLG